MRAQLASHMDGYVYQYALGGCVFLIGLWFAARQGYVGLRGRALWNLVWLCAGFAFFAALQGYLQYAPMTELPQQPYDGGFERDPTPGTALDYAIMGGYFAVILLIGTWYARKGTGTADFFFAGRRFGWGLIAFSLISTTVGSYSFIKYSRVAFDFGTSSSQSYLNDWVWMPLLVFGWLPILYFARITSVPEYFERRFGRHARGAATLLVLVYLVSYVGVNLFTMGRVLELLLGWDVLLSATLVALVSMAYVTAGGQTSVIMTDLFQGVMLLATGVLILVLGAMQVGGAQELWNSLPRGHRTAFHNFNADPTFPSVGITWQDGIANTAMFYFLNQGIVMRFMSARSVDDGRRAMLIVMLVLMPVAACVVAAGGWVARALVTDGQLPDDIEGSRAFVDAADFLSRPGVFGLILAALTAALMSTLDTLITAVAAIVVNDVYKPYLRPNSTDAQQLRVARVTSVAVAILGICLVPTYAQFKSIYEAHGAVTAAVPPPLVVALLLAVFWRRFTATAAVATILGGAALILLSVLVPDIITPFAHGVAAGEPGDGFLGGLKQHKFMRACFGMVASLAIGVIVTLWTRPTPRDRQQGLVWGTAKDPSLDPTHRRRSSAAHSIRDDELQVDRSGHAHVKISRQVAESLQVAAGEQVYVTDPRWWTGGMRSTHAIVDEVTQEAEPTVYLPGSAFESVVGSRSDKTVRVMTL